MMSNTTNLTARDTAILAAMANLREVHMYYQEGAASDEEVQEAADALYAAEHAPVDGTATKVWGRWGVAIPTNATTVEAAETEFFALLVNIVTPTHTSTAKIDRVVEIVNGKARCFIS